MTGHKTDEIIKELFEFILQKYQLEERMRGEEVNLFL